MLWYIIFPDSTFIPCYSVSINSVTTLYNNELNDMYNVHSQITCCCNIYELPCQWWTCVKCDKKYCTDVSEIVLNTTRNLCVMVWWFSKVIICKYLFWSSISFWPGRLFYRFKFITFWLSLVVCVFFTSTYSNSESKSEHELSLLLLLFVIFLVFDLRY